MSGSQQSDTQLQKNSQQKNLLNLTFTFFAPHLCEVDKELLRCPSQPFECFPNHDFELQSISSPLLEGVIEEVQKIP